MSDKNTVDYDLDLWINYNVYKVARKGRYAPAVSKYTNRAIAALADLDVPFQISRTAEGRWRVQLYHIVGEGGSWQELAYPICKAIYQLITQKEWKADE